MPSPSNPSASQAHLPTLKNIQAPPAAALTPQKRFEAEVTAEVQKRSDDITKKTFDYFTMGAGRSLADFTDILSHDKAKYTEAQYQQAVRAFIERVQKSTLTPANPANRPAPLFTTAHIAAHPYAATLPATLPISAVEDNLRKILHLNLEMGIKQGIEDAMKHIQQSAEVAKQKNIHNLCHLLSKTGPLTELEMNEWITKGAEEMSRHDRKRLAKTGLVSLPAKSYDDGSPPEPAVNATRNFGQLRTAKFLSALSSVVCTGVVAASLLAIPFFSVGAATAFGIATAAAVINLAVQKACDTYHRNTMKATWTEIRSELNKVQTDGCAAWAGTLYKFIREANPVWIGKNQTELFSQMFTTTPATTVGATLDHLKSAAIVALAQSHRLEQWQKGMNYKDHLNLCEPNLKKLEGRWNWWHDKQKLVAPYLAVGCAAGAVVAWPSAIPKF